MAAPVRELLRYITLQYAVEDEQKDVDLNANAAETGDDIESEKQDVAQREIDRADQLAEPFTQGLVAAYRAHRSGAAEIALDDRDPNENEMADALIGFLVSYGLASSRSEETEPMHYRYFIAVDWDRLRSVADAAGVDVDRALAA